MASHRSWAVRVTIAAPGSFQARKDGAHALPCAADSPIELLHDFDGAAQANFEHIDVDHATVELGDDPVELRGGFRVPELGYGPKYIVHPFATPQVRGHVASSSDRGGS